MPEPLRHHVVPVLNSILHSNGVPTHSVSKDALQHTPDPSCGAQSVVPIKEEDLALKRESTGQDALGSLGGVDGGYEWGNEWGSQFAFLVACLRLFRLIHGRYNTLEGQRLHALLLASLQ